MSKPFSKDNLLKMREARSKGQQTLTALADQNDEPLKGVEAVASKLPTLQPYSTGDPVRDLQGINRQLNHLPQMLETKSRRELETLWDQLDTVDKRTIWIRGHIANTLNTKFGEGTIVEFAESRGLAAKTIYDCMRVVNTFHSIEDILSPSFYMKAIALAHGEKDDAVKLIEMAKEKKEKDINYSVRDFIGDAAAKLKRTKDTSPKLKDPVKLVDQVYSLLVELKKVKEIDSKALSRLKGAKDLLEGILKNLN
jgi:hypothetical protein